MDSQTARIKLTDLMRKHRDYGAQDNEGWAAMDEVAKAATEGRRFPLAPHKNDDEFVQIIKRNPFQLYESVAGWEQASAKLVAAAEVYWKALVSEKVDITILRRSASPLAAYTTRGLIAG